MSAILDTVQRVLDGERKAAAGPLIINRYDEPAGVITYQLQQERAPGDVLCGLSDDDCPRARITAHYVADIYTAAPDLARFVLLVQQVLVECYAEPNPGGFPPLTTADVDGNKTIDVIRRRLGLAVPK